MHWFNRLRLMIGLIEPSFFGHKKILEINSPSHEVTFYTVPFFRNLVVQISTVVLVRNDLAHSLYGGTRIHIWSYV